MRRLTGGDTFWLALAAIVPVVLWAVGGDTKPQKRRRKRGKKRTTTTRATTTKKPSAKKTPTDDGWIRMGYAKTAGDAEAWERGALDKGWDVKAEKSKGKSWALYKRA